MDVSQHSSLQKSKDTLVSTESKIVYMDEQRKGKIDLYICCQDVIKGSDSIYTTKYAVEKAILACHSAVFSNMFADCISNDSEEVEEISLNENSEVTLTFLQLIYGKIDFPLNDFDLWVDVIELGDKHCANMVVDRAIPYLSDAFIDIAEETTAFSLRYDKAAGLKLLEIHRRLKNGDLKASRLASEELSRVIYCYWREYCERCGVEFIEKAPCSCGGCPNECCGHKGFSATYERSPCSLVNFLDKKTATLFHASDIVAFQTALEKYMVENNDFRELCDEYFI